MDFKTLKTGKLMLRYVLPQMLGLVFNSVYFIVDGVFIGRVLGSTALAAAGVAVPAVEMMIALSMMLAAGSGVLISAAAGRGDKKAAQDTFSLAVAVTLFISLVLAAAGTLFTRPLAAALGADGALMEGTTTYLRLFMGFSPFLVFSYALSAWARNDGAPRLAMWSLTVGALSNVLLDWVFMVPLNMGIGGAALATGLGPVFSVLILLPHFIRKKGLLRFSRPHVTFKGVGRMLAAGLPSFAAEFALGFVTLLYNLAILRAGLGEDGVAAYMVIGYAALICLTAFLGAAQGVQPPVSYFAGAGNTAQIHRLLRVSMLFCLGLSGVFYLALFFGGGAFFGIFLEDAALRGQAVGYARIYFVMLPLAAVNILLISFMQSMGRTVASLIVSLLRSTLPVMLMLWLLPMLAGQNGLWLAATAAEACALCAAVPLWKKGGAARRIGNKTQKTAA